MVVNLQLTVLIQPFKQLINCYALNGFILQPRAENLRISIYCCVKFKKVKALQMRFVSIVRQSMNYKITGFYQNRGEPY